MNEASKLDKTADVSLREITEKTVTTIIKLSDTHSEQQKKMVAPNAVSIAQAHFSDKAWFRAIYADEEPVGFIMLYDDPKKPEYFLWRLMIAAQYQGKGFGERAVKLLIEHVKTRPNARELLVSYVPMEGGPMGFYHKLGFKENGQIEHDEVVMSLPL